MYILYVQQTDIDIDMAHTYRKNSINQSRKKGSKEGKAGIDFLSLF